MKDLKKYEAYLKYLNEKLGKFFQEQAPYIFCKEGCSHCCESGEYPLSEVEFAYLNLGARTLPLEVFQQIDKNNEHALREFWGSRNISKEQIIDSWGNPVREDDNSASWLISEDKVITIFFTDTHHAYYSGIESR